MLLADVFIVVDPSYDGLKNLHNSAHRHTHIIGKFLLYFCYTCKMRTTRERTFSSEGMVSLSLAIRLDTCSMPKLRNSSLPTTSVKCCSAGTNCR